MGAHSLCNHPKNGFIFSLEVSYPRECWVSSMVIIHHHSCMKSLSGERERAEFEGWRRTEGANVCLASQYGQPQEHVGPHLFFLIHNCYSCQCTAVSGSLHAPAAFAKNPLVSHESSIIPLLSEEVKLFQLMENLFTLLTI